MPKLESLRRDISAETLAADLMSVIDLETLDTDLYRGRPKVDGLGHAFGGLVIAQALQAAQRSAAEKIAHSLHAYFMRAGDETQPIVYRVARDFEGRSFANRRVIALQNGQPILSMAASFQLVEEGLTHQRTMPDAPPADNLVSERELRLQHIEAFPEPVREFLLKEQPIEVRPIAPRNWTTPEKSAPVEQSWFRCAARLPDEQSVHRAVLAYLSDINLLATATRPHCLRSDKKLKIASLDHAIWFHGAFRADDWLLYSCDSPWAGRSRGFNRGQIFTTDGRLVASTAQEGLIRLGE